jgi:hypothetical protein
MEAVVPDSVKDDDQDFETPARPAKSEKDTRGKPQPVQSPAEATSTPAEDLPAAPAKPRFPSRMMKEAEEYGFSPEELDEIETTADLRELLAYERSKQGERKAAQMGRVATGREGSQQGNAPAPPAPPEEKPAPPPEDEWNFENDLSYLEESAQKEMKRLGKAALKASKSASKDELAELKKQLEETQATLQSLQAANHPAVIRAEKLVTTKYSGLFGAGKDAEPGSWEAYRYKQLIDFINGPFAESGKATRIPEKDIPAAIAILFPGSKADGDEPEPTPQPAPKKAVAPPTKPATNSRIEEWNQSGQAAPTGRNGAEKTGIASDKDAKKTLRNGLAKMGMSVDAPGSDEDDDLNDF